MPQKIADFKISPRIIFGSGAIKKIGVEAKALGGSRVLIVTDRGIVKAGLIKEAEESLRSAGLRVAVFSQVEPEPWRDTADEAAGAARAEAADLIIGIGGGSAMDIAKATAILATNEGKAQDFQGLNKVPRPGLPKIMVPTTAGTGSEATFTAVLSNKEPKGKAGINSPYLFPELALLDPLLTLSAPAEITASTGMDALTHAIEAYTSLQSSVMSDIIALEAIRLLSPNLPRVIARGNDLEAREAMLLGSLLAGIALANAGVTAVHALSYPLGGLFRVAHGVANGLLLPYVMDFNIKEAPEKFAQVARALGEDTKDLSLEQAAGRGVAAINKLMAGLPVPRKLKELKAGISEANFPEMAAAAMKVSRPLENNPRPLGPEEAIWIYRQAF